MNEIAVVGMGYVGMCAALSLADAGTPVRCIGPLAPSTDTRSTALFPESVALLETIGIWDRVADAARPLEGIRIIDEAETIFKAPEITFRAKDCGLDALAMNVPNHALHDALMTRIIEIVPEQNRHAQTLVDVNTEAGEIQMELKDGPLLKANIVIAADGRQSKLRQAAGIETRTWYYDQTAIACAFTHSEPHHNISSEFHRPAGPLTTVPGPDTMDGYTSHIVWMERPETAQTLMSLPDATFRDALEDALQGVVGEVKGTGTRGAFPIHGQTATRFAAHNVYLVGETAHVIPPIGAQGMNLGLRDVEGLRGALAQDNDHDETRDAEDFYNRHRRNDVFLRTTAVDLLNRSLTTPYWPAQAMRGVGLHLLNTFPPLKRAAMRAGFGN